MEPDGAPDREGEADPGGRSPPVPSLEALSSDEVRALLDDFPAAPLGEGVPAAGAQEPARTLVVSRQPDDVLLLKRCLENAGSSVSLARNPFTALDHIRAELPDAVVSDFDLWVNDGALLFARIREAGRRLPVLFLADRTRAEAGRLAARASRAGAAGLLLRPLKPWEVEVEVRALLDLARGEAAGTNGAASPDATAMRDDGGEETEGAGAPVNLVLEVAWLRFFREGTRLLIQPPALPRDPAGALLRAARVELGAAACGFFHAAGDCPIARLEGRAGLDQEDLARLAAFQAAAPPGAGRLVFTFGPSGREGRLVLAGLAPEVVAAAAAFREDLSALLDSLFGT